jgi:hypothetical protein
MRRYRYSHLRSDSTVPMSIRNYDRHGLENLKHDHVKPLDRLKIPPFVIYIWFFGAIIYVFMKYFENEEFHFDKMQRKNLLLSARRT